MNTNFITGKGLLSLHYLLKSTCLKNLSLRGNRLDGRASQTEDEYRWPELIRRQGLLSSLDLSSLSPNAALLEGLLESIAQCTRLKYLNLDKNAMGPQGICAMSEKFRQRHVTQLQALRLQL